MENLSTHNKQMCKSTEWQRYSNCSDYNIPTGPIIIIGGTDRIVGDDRDNWREPSIRDMQLAREREEAKEREARRGESPHCAARLALITTNYDWLPWFARSFNRFVFKIKCNYPCANRRRNAGDLARIPECDDRSKEMEMRCIKWNKKRN